MTINALNIIPIKTDSCPALDSAAAKKKMTVSWGNHKFGDIILYDFNKNGTADHTGIVIGKNASTILAIEGNTGAGSNTNGGQVQVRTRSKSTIKRFARPKYNKTVTPAMVVYTALGQVGTVESPKNSNKVKYNRWFYGKNTSAFWCMTFVCWNFGNVETIPIAKKPTSKYSGVIPSGIKYGSKGTNVKNLQKFLNWYLKSLKIVLLEDGECGAKTTRAIMVYQNTEGLSVDGDFGANSSARAKTYLEGKKTPAAATTPPAKTATVPQPSAKALKAVEWGRSIVKSGKYTYKKFDVKVKKTKQCPICHKLTGKYKGWNCIGFVSSCWHDGAGLKSVTCACNGIGTDGFFTNVTLDSWTKRNGKGWQMITNGGGKGGADIPASKLIAGDTLICYDASGKFHHIALYAGNGKILESTKTRKPNVGERTYKDLCDRHHVTRAFRYTG